MVGLKRIDIWKLGNRNCPFLLSITPIRGFGSHPHPIVRPSPVTLPALIINSTVGYQLNLAALSSTVRTLPQTTLFCDVTIPMAPFECHETVSVTPPLLLPILFWTPIGNGVCVHSDPRRAYVPHSGPLIRAILGRNIAMFDLPPILFPLQDVCPSCFGRTCVF